MYVSATLHERGSPAVRACDDTNRVSLSLILGVWLLLKHTSIRPGKFPFWKSMLKLCCCVFDALIKKSHFICIINATEMKRREGKTALNVQRNTKSLFFFICLLLRRWPRCICRFSEWGVWQGRGLFEQKLWKHTAQQFEQAASILNQRAHQELSDHLTGSKDPCYAFYFFCSVFLGLRHWRFLRFPEQTEQVQNEVISAVKMSLHPPLMLEGWDNNLTFHCMKL